MARVCVTGGCGYVGSVLVPKLLAAGHEVWVFDIGWFGLYHKKHENLFVFHSSFTNAAQACGKSLDAIIHLAAVANDPAGDLDPKLTWETNALGTMQLADAAARALVKQFIYASSGSVYGVNDAPQITEDLPLEPLTEYNKTKMVAERCVLSYAHQMQVQIVRPATVCGWSPRQRLDVIINRHALQALSTGTITVHGGKQMRPHITMDDMTDLYCWLLNRPHLTGIFNAGFEDYTVEATAMGIALTCNADIKYLPSTDPRSYRMNSDKLRNAGFEPRMNVARTILDLKARYAAGTFKDGPECHNIETMRRLHARG